MMRKIKLVLSDFLSLLFGEREYSWLNIAVLLSLLGFLALMMMLFSV